MPDTDLSAKMEKIRNLSLAIHEGEKDLKKNPGMNRALALQRLRRQRRDLQVLLPPIKLITLNGRIV